MKITIEVEKKDYYRQQLEAPKFSVLQHPLVQKCGTPYWEWNYSQLSKLTEDEMEELYNVCKKSKEEA